jgi:hypothetical protein
MPLTHLADPIADLPDTRPFTGIDPAAPVALADGRSVPARDLVPGVSVALACGGAAPVVAVLRSGLPQMGEFAAVTLPAMPGMPALTVPARQRFLVASPFAELWFGEVEVMVPALAFVRLGDGSLCPPGDGGFVQPVLDRPGLILAAGRATESAVPPAGQPGHGPAPRRVLAMEEAVMLLRLIRASERRGRVAG